jgi:hypothetical protein
MPAEFSRTTARKTILLPSGDRVKVPVITNISFIDPLDRYQETQHALDNTENSTRLAHVDQVHAVPVDENGVPTDDPPRADTGEGLFVERVDTWKALDAIDRGQETQLTLDNRTGNDLLPPHFSNHTRTHIYRYFQDPSNPDDNAVWIDSELIDEVAVIDAPDRGQETRYTLVNPTNAQFQEDDLSGQASDNDPDLTIGGDAEGTEANPVRLDPFQNIVNYSSGAYVLVQWTWHDYQEQSANEVWIRSQLLGLVDTFVPGIASILHSTNGNNTITFDEDNSQGATLVFQSGLLEDEATTAGPGPQGLTEAIHIFGPCESPPIAAAGVNLYQPAGCPDMSIPPPHMPLIQYYDDSASVPIIGYQRTFLFRAAPTPDSSELPTSEQANTTKIMFTVANAIAQTPAIINYGTYTVATTGSYTQQTAVTDIGGFRFHVYVFSSGLVEPYLADEEFPLRKKGIDPTDTGSLAETLDLPNTSVNCSAVLAYNEGGNIVPVLGNGTYEIRLESFTVPDDEPNKTRTIPWPKRPGFVTSGGQDYRRYHYSIWLGTTGGELENDPPDIKFGIPPP